MGGQAGTTLMLRFALGCAVAHVQCAGGLWHGSVEWKLLGIYDTHTSHSSGQHGQLALKCMHWLASLNKLLVHAQQGGTVPL
jgi:hypothetical protein